MPVGLVQPQRPKTSRDVHIVPIAREVDRAVLPFVTQDGKPPVLHAHKIILLVPQTAQARRVAARVEKALSTVTQVETTPLAVDIDRPTAGFQGILQQIARLCFQESEAGNRVHINLSSGTKLVAFAAGLAGMAHIQAGKGSIYYVQPAGYSFSEAEFEAHGHTKGILDIEELELMPVLLPEPVQLRILNYLKYRPEAKAEYRDLVSFLAEIPDSGYRLPEQGGSLRVRNWNNAVTTRMVRKVLSPLREGGLIEILDEGRQKSAQITTRGLLYASMAGTERDRLKTPLFATTSTTSTEIPGHA